jgi:hypothetical protein
MILAQLDHGKHSQSNPTCPNSPRSKLQKMQAAIIKKIATFV